MHGQGHIYHSAAETSILLASCAEACFLFMSKATSEPFQPFQTFRVWHYLTLHWWPFVWNDYALSSGLLCVYYLAVVSWWFVCVARHDRNNQNADVFVQVIFCQGKTYLFLFFFHFFLLSLTSILTVSIMSQFADIYECLYWCCDYYSLCVILSLRNSKNVAEK